MEHESSPRGDPHATGSFATGRTLALSWRGWLACRWQVLGIVLPLSIVNLLIARATSPTLEERVSYGWQFAIEMWLNATVQIVAFVALTFATGCYLRGQSMGIRSLLRLPWRRLPAALVASLFLQTVTYWPIFAFDWGREDSGRVYIDYLIVAINVLTIDTFTFIYLPILLTEDRSLTGTLIRGFELVRPRAWRILALDLFGWAVLLPLSHSMWIVYGSIGESWGKLAWSAMSIAWTALMISFGCCIPAAAYHLLRAEREGPEPGVVAQVFD
jgi:hypothetical protein